MANRARTLLTRPLTQAVAGIATRLIVLAVSVNLGSAFGSDRRWKTAMSAGETAYEQCRFVAAENHFRHAATQAMRFELSDPRLWQTVDAMAQVYAAEVSMTGQRMPNGER